MKINLDNYERFVSNKILELENGLKKANVKSDFDKISNGIIRLQRYHREQVQNFQHERLIHLLVTLFFAGLMIITFVGVLVFSLNYNFDYITILMSLLCLILLVTELFYIKHYYYLENGTQKLYKYTNKLYKLISNPNLQK